MISSVTFILDWVSVTEIAEDAGLHAESMKMLTDTTNEINFRGDALSDIVSALVIEINYLSRSQTLENRIARFLMEQPSRRRILLVRTKRSRNTGFQF